ncbi:MAG TPA: hypothetical protein VH187_07970 [Scandinavium sp.]|nr:hypothetical protein [Scandinavium sp.]
MEESTMLLTREELELSKLVSKEESRSALRSLGVDKDCSVVTNGHYLVTVPHSTELKEENFPVTPGLTPANVEKMQLVNGVAASAALKAIPRKNTIPVLRTAVLGTDNKLYVNDLTNVSTFDSKAEGQFPNYKAVLPADNAKPVVTIGLSAEYVRLLADYMAKNGAGESPNIVLTVYSPEKAVKMETKTEDGRQITAVLMPVRLEGPRTDVRDRNEAKALTEEKSSPAPSQPDSTPTPESTSADTVQDSTFCWVLAAKYSASLLKSFLDDVHKYREATALQMLAPVAVHGLARYEAQVRVAEKRVARIAASVPKAIAAIAASGVDF